MIIQSKSYSSPAVYDGYRPPIPTGHVATWLLRGPLRSGLLSLDKQALAYASGTVTIADEYYDFLGDSGYVRTPILDDDEITIAVLARSMATNTGNDRPYFAGNTMNANGQGAAISVGSTGAVKGVVGITNGTPSNVQPIISANPASWGIYFLSCGLTSCRFENVRTGEFTEAAYGGGYTRNLSTDVFRVGDIPLAGAPQGESQCAFFSVWNRADLSTAEKTAWATMAADYGYSQLPGW